MMKLERHKKPVSLSEIHQDMAIRFAICTPTNDGEGVTQITPSVRCRDFMCDVYSSTKQKKDFKIYGMEWKGTTDSPSWDGVYLLVSFPDAAALKNFEKNVPKIWAIEEANGYTPTEVHETDNKLERILVGQKDWLNSVLSFSLYTLLVRVCGYKLSDGDWVKDFGDQEFSDSKYIHDFPRESWDKVTADLSLLKLDEWNGLTFAEHQTHGVHHNSGIIGVFSTHTEANHETVRKNKHWQHFQKLGLPTYVKAK